MMNYLLVGDYCLIVIGVFFAIMGLFKGLSGNLAFLVSLLASSIVARPLWNYLSAVLESLPLRIVAILIVSLLFFGLVRLVVKKCINGLLAQPADAIFGFISGAAIGLLLALLWAWVGISCEYSLLVMMVNDFIK